MFPPLCNRIKVELCDSDAISDEPIATHFIELPQIMDPGGEAEGKRRFFLNFLNHHRVKGPYPLGDVGVIGGRIG